jgi:hypothetical protein
VTDDDLGRLAGCDNLLAIGLEETDVTDSGVRQLLKLPKLHHYELRGTSTSTSLRRALGSE